MFAATIVTLQFSLGAKSDPGSSVNVVGPPVTVAECVPEVAHEIVNQEPLMLTGSLKVTEMFALTDTSTAPFVGIVVCTPGAWSLDDAVTEMSSIPTHSSLPTAFV